VAPFEGRVCDRWFRAAPSCLLRTWHEALNRVGFAVCKLDPKICGLPPIYARSCFAVGRIFEACQKTAAVPKLPAIFAIWWRETPDVVSAFLLMSFGAALGG